jgi:fatty acid desaturase
MTQRTYLGVEIPIPYQLNIALIAIAGSAAAGLLWAASHADGVAVMLAAAIAFSYVNNTLFSLLHEATHGTLHPHRRANDLLGVLCAAFFPTGFTVQRIAHLGHHRRNRTDLELFDYVLPGENRWRKAYIIGCLLAGSYWALMPGAVIALFLDPHLPRRRGFRRLGRYFYGFIPFVEDLARAPAHRVRAEMAITLAWQLGMFVLLDLSWQGWLVCYWAFGLNWSSLQYADHAWSVRDIRNGAWNLRVNPVVQWLFLNYHHHLAHHQHPCVPWLHLPKFVDFSAPRRSFMGQYLSLWGGPRLAPEPAPAAPPPEFMAQIAD